MRVRKWVEIFSPISTCFSLHPFILVDRTLYVHLPISPFPLWDFLAMEDWICGGPCGGTWFLVFDEFPIEVVTLYLYFYINRIIHFSSKFHVQLFIFVSMVIVALYIFKCIMLVWMLTFNIFYVWIYIFCWGKIVGNNHSIVSSTVVFFEFLVEVWVIFLSC